MPVPPPVVVWPGLKVAIREERQSEKGEVFVRIVKRKEGSAPTAEELEILRQMKASD